MRRNKRFFDERSDKVDYMVNGAWFMVMSLMLIALVGCSKEDDTIEIVPQRHWVEKTVAVVAPTGDAVTKTRMERTASWFLENFTEAQRRDTLAIRLQIEWHDELTEDLNALSADLANRDDIVAIIGPFANESVETFAAACRKTLKPLIVPTATSEDIIRRYAVTTGGLNTNATPFLWSLTETDVEFTSLLMSAFATEAKYNSYVTSDPIAAVFSPDDAYGMTFNYWAPFYAQQDNIQLLANQQYGSTEQLLSLFSDCRPQMKAHGLASSAIFCVAETTQQLYQVARANRQALLSDPIFAPFMPSTDPDDPANDDHWQILVNTYKTYFGFSGLSEEGLAALGPRGTKMLQGYEGFSPYADPTTGFELSYQQRFGQLPTFAECKFYDALMLAAFAACYVEHQHPVVSDPVADNDAINQAIITLTLDADDAQLGGAAWNATSMEVYLSAMERGQLLHFVAASGEISFDRDTYTAATQTTYVRWQIMDDRIHHRRYFGGTGGRSADAKAAWMFLYNEQQASADFDSQAAAVELTYPARTDQYAVLVQGSEGFINYRHQADVLNIYQQLRRAGYPDDHIILVIDKAMAASADNPERGIVRTAPDGPDLLSGTGPLPAAVVDYDNATLTARDIADILLGHQSERLQEVVPQGEGHNVLLYWSVHGRNIAHGGANEFCWRNAASGQGFTGSLLRETASQMQYRKLLVCAEPCYGEVVIREVEGLHGVLAMSGASSEEQSWADCWSNEARVWMCDRFSMNLSTCLADNPQTSFRDLFLYCARHTLGSHAKIVNAANFGNLYTTGPAEFILYNK